MTQQANLINDNFQDVENTLKLTLGDLEVSLQSQLADYGQIQYEFSEACQDLETCINELQGKEEELNRRKNEVYSTQEQVRYMQSSRC